MNADEIKLAKANLQHNNEMLAAIDGGDWSPKALEAFETAGIALSKWALHEKRIRELEADVERLSEAARKAEAYLDATAGQQPASGMAAEIRSELLAALEDGRRNRPYTTKFRCTTPRKR